MQRPGAASRSDQFATRGRCDTVSVRAAAGKAGVVRNEPWWERATDVELLPVLVWIRARRRKASCATGGSVDQTIGTGSAGGLMRALGARVLPLQVTAVLIARRLQRCA